MNNDHNLQLIPDSDPIDMAQRLTKISNQKTIFFACSFGSKMLVFGQYKSLQWSADEQMSDISFLSVYGSSPTGKEEGLVGHSGTQTLYLDPSRTRVSDSHN